MFIGLVYTKYRLLNSPFDYVILRAFFKRAIPSVSPIVRKRKQAFFLLAYTGYSAVG